MSEDTQNGKDRIVALVSLETSKRFRQICLDNGLKMNEQFEVWVEREWKHRNADLEGAANGNGKRGAKA